MSRAAIYARVSSDRQEEQKTIESQVAELRAACERAGDRLVGEYLDDGVSGASLVRPELDRLRDDARRGVFERLYLLSPDRLARRYVYQAIVLDELRKQGIEVRFLDKAVTDRPEDQLLIGMQGLIAEYERALIIERSRRGRLFRARRGEIMGGPAPYGYRYVHKTADRPAHYVIDEAEADVVRRIFDLYLKHQSINQVVVELDRAGIRPPGSGEFWARTVVHRILRRESYIGVSHYNKDEYNGGARKRRSREEWISVQVPAIVRPEVFRQAQDLLAVHKPNARTRVYLLTGLMRCAACGSRYGGTCPRRGRDAYYRCNNDAKRFPRPRNCSGGMVRVDRVEPAVLNVLESALADQGVLAEHLTELFDRALEKARLRKDGGAPRELAALARREERLLDLYLDGTLARADYLDRRRQIEARRVELERQVDLRPPEPLSDADRERVLAGLEEFCRLARARLREADPRQQRLFLRQVVERVTFDRGTNTARVVIRVPADPEPASPLRQVTGGGVPATRGNTLTLELETVV